MLVGRRALEETDHERTGRPRGHVVSEHSPGPVFCHGGPPVQSLVGLLGHPKPRSHFDLAGRCCLGTAVARVPSVDLRHRGVARRGVDSKHPRTEINIVSALVSGAGHVEMGTAVMVL